MDFPGNARLKYSFTLLFILLFLRPMQAFAFPEMIRHGYVNCLACHTNQQGGTLLTAYGKELGKELLNRHDTLFTFEKDKDEDRYWQINTPDYLTIGANVRLLQIFSESSAASKGRFLIMQVDVDTAVKLSEEFQTYFSVGRYEPTQPEAEWKDFAYVPRAWVQYTKTADNSSNSISLRLGRFYPTYGLNMIEHTYVNRRYLDFNPGQERLAVELSFNSENFQVVLTGLTERANYQKYDSEKGSVLQFSKVVGQSARLGLNIYRTKLTQNNIQAEKKMDGLFGLIGWNKEITTLIQLDQIQYDSGKKGFSDYIKQGYEYKKGIELFATQEYFNSDTTLTDPHVEAYGLGVQYFPFSNLDLFLTYKKHKDTSQLNEFQDMVWFITHLYF